MKKIFSVVLLAASLQAAVPHHAQAGLILGGAIGGNTGNAIGSVFLGAGIVSMVAGYAIGCDRSETTRRRVPVYEMRRDRYGRMVRVRVGTRMEETTRCVVWNGNTTASTLLWVGLGAIILDSEVNSNQDALDTALQEKLPFVESVDALNALANTIRSKAAPIFASGKNTAIVSLTEEETLRDLSEAVLTDAEKAEAVALLK